MANFDQAAELNLMTLSDDDDLRLFNNSIEHPGLARKILRIKYNDPGDTYLELKDVDDLNESAARRLGYILGQNSTLKALRIRSRNMDVSGFCIRLQGNRSIQRIDFNGRFEKFGPMSDQQSKPEARHPRVL